MAIGLIMVVHIALMTMTIGRFEETFAVRLALSGWPAVDLFFVLSGFLITGILLDTRGAPGYFRSFYARRTLRVFPLYYGVLALVFFLAPALMDPSPQPLESIVDRQFWYWTYLTNVRVAMEGSWSATPLFTSHFWTLAVEEQFYLIWPVVVLALRRERLIRFCVIGCLICPLLRAGLLWQGAPPIAIYVLTPTRLDPLLAGAALAAWVRGDVSAELMRRWAKVAIGIAAVGLIGFFAFEGRLDELSAPVQIVGYSFVVLLWSGLLALLLGPNQEAALLRVFASRPMTLLGKYSYGIYIVHLPLIVVVLLSQAPWLKIVHEQLGSTAVYIVVGVLSLAVSTAVGMLSWWAWEKRFLGLKRHFPYPRR